jgi:hypothetical protein
MKRFSGNIITSIEVDDLLVTVGGQLPGEIRGAYYLNLSNCNKYISKII